MRSYRCSLCFHTEMSSQNDRKWCIVTAGTLTILTGREIAPVRQVFWRPSPILRGVVEIDVPHFATY